MPDDIGPALPLLKTRSTVSLPPAHSYAQPNGQCFGFSVGRAVHCKLLAFPSIHRFVFPESDIRDAPRPLQNVDEVSVLVDSIKERRQMGRLA